MEYVPVLAISLACHSLHWFNGSYERRLSEAFRNVYYLYLLPRILGAIV